MPKNSTEAIGEPTQALLPYTPTPALLNLISDIANAPSLDSRFLAGVTLTMTMDEMLTSGATEQRMLSEAAHAAASGCAADPEFELTHDAKGRVTDIQWGPSFRGSRYADLVLAMMKIDDVSVRRVALEGLVAPGARDDAAAMAVTDGAIRRFLGWVEQENRTRH